MNVLSTKAELFIIRYSISQASQIQDIIYIVVITDAIPTVKNSFDMSLHPYQLHSIAIFSNLRKFFNKKFNNTISFWDYSINNNSLCIY